MKRPKLTKTGFVLEEEMVRVHAGQIWLDNKYTEVNNLPRVDKSDCRLLQEVLDCCRGITCSCDPKRLANHKETIKCRVMR